MKRRDSFAMSIVSEPVRRTKTITYMAIRIKVYLVLEGQGQLRFGSEERALGPGEGTMAPAGEAHGPESYKHQAFKVLVFVAPNP